MGLLSTLSLSLSSSSSLSLCVSLSLYLSWMLLTHCQDHILTEKIWFVWSKTSYSGDKWRCHLCRTDDERTREDRAICIAVVANIHYFFVSTRTWFLKSFLFCLCMLLLWFCYCSGCQHRLLFVSTSTNVKSFLCRLLFLFLFCFVYSLQWVPTTTDFKTYMQNCSWIKFRSVPFIVYNLFVNIWFVSWWCIWSICLICCMLR